MIEEKGRQMKNLVRRSVVRSRCLDFVDFLRKEGWTHEIPLETAKELFQELMGIVDRTSIRAYFGTQPTKSVRKMHRIARYPSGVVSFKALELVQDITRKKGYLEVLGLATIEKKGQTWFLKIREESIVPDMSPQHYEKVSSASIREISLSSILPFSQGEGSEGNLFEKIPFDVTQTNNNIQGEREKSQSS